MDGWVFFSAEMDEDDRVSTHVFFAAIADRDAAVAAAGKAFDIDQKFNPDGTDVVPIDDCNDNLKELAGKVQAGSVELIATIDPATA